MAIKIGDVYSFARPTQWTTTPDDRQTKIEIIDGVHVQNYGVIDAGLTIGCTVVLSAASWTTVKGYWTARTLVSVIDENGTTWTSRRVVVKSYNYVERFPKYVTVTLEFWGV